VPKIGVFTHVRTLEPIMIADLDTLLIALYVELTDRIIPSLGFTRSGPGKPPEVTDAELVCLAVAQVLLALTMSGTGCAPLLSRWGTCSPGCWASRSTTSGSRRSRR
jgi:hypothetical protein